MPRFGANDLLSYFPYLAPRQVFFGSTEAHAATGKDTPGPGAYPVINNAFTNKEPKQQAPAIKGRVEVIIAPSSSTIGPGQYFEGLQQDRSLSSRASLRNIQFGAAPPRRNSLPGSLAESAHRGPGALEGINSDMNLSTCPVSRMSTLGPKFREVKSNIVDAAAQKPIESVGPQFLSTKKSAPAPALKGRNRFGSMYDI